MRLASSEQFEQGSDQPHLAVLMTTYNRAAMTRRSLHALNAACDAAGVDYTLFLADASSTDETVESVIAAAKSCNVEVVPDTQFWAQGMRTAWMAASKTSYDYLMWLNDDVQLDHDALVDVFDLLDRVPTAVVGIPMRGTDGTLSYGGYMRGSLLRRLSLVRMAEADIPQACDALNGNAVIMSRATDVRLGGFPDEYVHSMADLAYTLRASSKGVPVLVLAGTGGACASNPPRLSTGARGILGVRQAMAPKRFPVGPWFRFCWSWGGASSLAYFFKPYITAWIGR